MIIYIYIYIYIYDQRNGKNPYMSLFTKSAIKKNVQKYRTIVLISNASKILMIILQKILEPHYLIPELPIEQAGFPRGRGTIYHIDNLRWMMEKARDHKRKLFICFIDYKRAFECVDHQRLWWTLKYMEYQII